MQKIKFKNQEFNYKNGELIFNLSKNKLPIFMCYRFKNYEYDTHIVLVKGKEFLELWRKDYPEKIKKSFPIIEKDTSEFKDDLKFKDAEKLINESSENNAVPLAEANCLKRIEEIEGVETKFFFLKKIVKIENKICYVSFTNGGTRTLFLLYHGIKEFFVSVTSEKEAKLLAEKAGVNKNSYYSTKDILKCIEKNN